MHIVITGGSGFIGQTLVPRVLAGGAEITLLDRRPASWLNSPTVQDTAWATSVRQVTGDLVDQSDDMVAALRSADAVIHLAACPGVRDDRRDIAYWRYHDNVLATHAVATCTPLETPLIALSSSSVYGGAMVTRGGAIRPCMESDVLQPRGGYAESKVLAEEICRTRAAQGGHVLVVRPFTVMGEYQRPDMAVAVWARNAQRGEPITVFGDLQRTRDITDVRAVADVTMALLESGAAGVVNLGCGESRSLRDLAEAVQRAVGVEVPLNVVPAAPREVRHTLADTGRLAALIGSAPTTDIRRVVARAIASLPASDSSVIDSDTTQVSGVA